MNRLKIALCSMAAGSALALALAVPASPANAATAAGTRAVPLAAHSVPSALVKTTARPSMRTGVAAPNATMDGACNSLANGDGDFCFWFSTNFVGSLFDEFNSDANLSDNTFLTPGLGLGAVVANNSESSLNADSNLSVMVFTGANGTGAAGLVGPRQFGNFNATFVNNVESFAFV